MEEFLYVVGELAGVVKVNVKETLALFKGEIDTIEATIYTRKDGAFQKAVTKKDFLVNKGETHMEKYGEVLEKVISLTQ